MSENCANQCNQCNTLIHGPIIKCLEKTYHKSCFTCSKCKMQLDKQIYSLQENILCDKCYFESQEKCPVCEKLVIDCKYFSIDGKQYHTTCSLCTVCKRKLTEIYYEKNGKFYCYDDYNKSCMPVCNKCGYHIRIDSNTGKYNYLQIDGMMCHLDCFNCDRCHEVLPTVSNFLTYFPLNGLKLCRSCFEYNQTKCIFPEINNSRNNTTI